MCGRVYQAREPVLSGSFFRRLRGDLLAAHVPGLPPSPVRSRLRAAVLFPIIALPDQGTASGEGFSVSRSAPAVLVHGCTTAPWAAADSLGAVRTDPTTGLLAFADLVAELPALTAAWLAGPPPSGVGIAIGDVDGLKSLIEARPPDGGLRGHVRGHRYMTMLGAVVLESVNAPGGQRLVAAALGGDEIVLVMAAPCPMVFDGYLSDLQHRISGRLSLGMSFAWTWRATPPASLTAASCLSLLMEIDDALIERKRARGPGQARGFCQPVRQTAAW